MLDADTKRRIDTCRDILVGKVPDPKSQVEQITIALIYKFMDDMDTQAEVLGGKRSFFINGFAQYSWPKLLSPALEGHETLSLYSQAIGEMRKNTHLPALFRDIFKNAYLPYRDPETLRSFLREIDGFTYDHSERLGDAFEYLLSVLGSQGDAGQFRTPRHIIDFMVEVVDPQKNERILDPACGTAGFLISAWKHILANNTDLARSPVLGNLLNTRERKQLAANIHGYDISPDMVRLSLVNLYLHGFTDPHIDEYDTLTNTERWGQHADVILANPPFMSPKGGIKPHKKFSIQATRSEVLFVDYMAEHLTPEGRAAIIVPEGIIFQSGTAYKKLREMLVKQSLIGVVSLPAGVFNPYSGVKTSILLLDKQRAKRQDKVLFVKIENDGFNLGAQRRPITQNDLPEAKRLIQAFLHSPETFEGGSLAHAVARERIGASGDWNLSGERYAGNDFVPSPHFNHVTLDTVVMRITDSCDPATLSGSVTYIGLENIEANTGRLIGEINVDVSTIKSLKSRFQAGDILYGKLRPNLNKVYVARSDGICSTDIFVLRPRSSVDGRLVATVLRSPKFNEQVLKGLGGAQLPRVSYEFMKALTIPLPPLDIQRGIVAEIEGYQKIIDGARQVVENYQIKVTPSPDWPLIRIGDLFHTKSGTTPRRNNEAYFANGEIPWVKTLDLTDGAIHGTDECITQAALDETHLDLLPKGTVLIAMYGGFNQIGRTGVLEIEATHNQAMTALLPTPKVAPYFLNAVLISSRSHWKKVANSTRKDPNITKQDVLDFQMPLPDIETQRAVAIDLMEEQTLINANKALITRFEAKIQSVLDRIWTAS